MVFKGRLSKGCENCRKLHTKCDEKRPACSRCVRMKRQCTGYREEVDLIFRHTIPRPRAKARNTVARGTHDYLQAQSRKSHDRNGQQRYITSPSKALLPSKEDQRLCFFYQTTLETLVDSDPTQYLHSQLPTLLLRSKSQSTLHLATKAIAHAAWARSNLHNPDLALSASKSYSKALSALAGSIENPIEAKSDETLYAVLLLSGYETITFNPEALPAWGTHVDGAAALVKHRGSKNFSTPLSCMMFLFIRRNAIQSHVQTSTPIDPIFEEGGETLSQFENIEDRLFSKTLLVPQLQNWANRLLSQSSSEIDGSSILELLQNAEKLDSELANWAFEIPVQWSYKNLVRMMDRGDPWSQDSAFVASQIHRYPNIYVARTWNLYRVSRLIIQSIIFRVSNSDSIMSDLYKDRIDPTNQSMVDGICASVPFLLGYDCAELKHPTSDPSQLWPQSSPIRPRESRNTGTFSLIWPLYVASSVSSIPEVQRLWLQDQLSWLAESGDAHAQVLTSCKSRTLVGLPEDFRFDCV